MEEDENGDEKDGNDGDDDDNDIYVRGNIHTCFPLFNIRSLKTLISIVVYLNMYNPLIVILCCFISSYCMFYALCFIFSVFLCI